MSVPLDDSLSEVLIDDLRLAWRANYGTGGLQLDSSLPFVLNPINAVAAFTVLVYDIILTSGREVS
jgi:hypothetical protein